MSSDQENSSFLASRETTIPNTIDMLRDGTSFPEDCDGVSHIEFVLDAVNARAARAKRRFVVNTLIEPAAPVRG